MATTIGEQLRLAREERGIALREISNQTRISMRYLEAIEADDYKRLPGGVFNRSFVKAYARSIGFDEHLAIEGYARLMREQGHPIDDELHLYHSKVYTDTPATRSPILTVALAILILGLLTLGALALVHWQRKRQSSVLETLPQANPYRHAVASCQYGSAVVSGPPRDTCNLRVN